MSSAQLIDATRVCWRLANAVTRERDRGWPGGYTPWAWLCCDIEHDRTEGLQRERASRSVPMRRYGL